MAILEMPGTRLEPGVGERIRRLKPGDRLYLGRPITVEEFYELIDEESNLELVNGVIVMPPPPSDSHEDLFGRLFSIVGGYVEERNLGQVRGSRSEMRISATSARQPDIAFVRSENLARLQRYEIAGPADFVVEIVDSDASRRHAVEKQAQYETLGVPELWIIDLPRRELRHFVLEEGRYRQLPVDPAGEVGARQIPGLRLRVSWLFDRSSAPSSFRVVSDLLEQAKAGDSFTRAIFEQPPSTLK